MAKELSAGVVSGQLIFIEHSAGDTIIEGKPVKWNNVKLSDGLASYKIANETGLSKDALASFKRGDSVVCELRLQPIPKKDNPTLVLVSIAPVKVA